MIGFDWKNPARMIFGKTDESKMLSLLQEHQVTSLLIVSGGRLPKALGIYDIIENACRKIGAELFECPRVVPNPKIELVREFSDFGKKRSIDFILAVGGGSAIDTAKALALGIPYDGDCWDFFSGKAQPEKALPIGVVTTIPASGSETSNAAILSNGLLKLGVESDILIPKFAFMDPEYTLDLPPFQTAAGCADILSHLVERYFTSVDHVDATDYMIEGALKALLLNARRLVKNPHDIHARSEVQLLASVAHNGFLELGRLSDWASHRIEHELSAQYDITHGEGMALILTAYIRYMAKKKPEKPAQLAQRVFGVDRYDYDSTEAAYILADEFEAFFKSMKLRTRLSEFDIGDTHFEEMALRATKGDTVKVGHYTGLDAKECIEVLKLAR